MKGGRGDADRLVDIVFAIERCHDHLEATSHDMRLASLAVDAVVRQIEVVGEAVAALSEATQGRSVYPWQKVKGLRNRLAHVYFAVNYDQIRNVYDEHLPALDEVARDLLRQLGVRPSQVRAMLDERRAQANRGATAMMRTPPPGRGR